ncbi:dihydroneopterin triphosphate pyrophosphatase [[Haemophilus] ducreyi]|uniref:Dihydroneopterin triphosphate pyrophosphatase n=1 Tax=Haemophilus ducreyi TaxID=730 RepID=A0AAC8ZA95_HAEDC|nr:dihydroneopterin triphosphate diphosphatase [[Haemophilus] ducreyi]AKO30614.1 dihydroneopterin triphosphate pyrophosphatase [[Haemophilus] ducreyi]AKO32051.1 dihydroneopterin triphosphate pyrophosphatase [[Haemophilus] ducreyi]AKO33507.1 dihydroneopterin triphosphate pyrophosphatase [[Haemophilus] ducreyi]AKO34953.1 dihydroneopterin triphosphate pyrophosphatase [[Haemophilus] ducreyi]AKO43436.1 dihydroneopterin triphosphate pyrophosphatase [[Haemophilus] ducreyi]
MLTTPYKNPNSVLIVIYAQNTKRVLMLQRKDDPSFWQSVTGSLEHQESALEAAKREVLEEVGIDITQQKLTIYDCQKSVKFEIFPHFRYKYAPNVTHCCEHWFLLALPNEQTPTLTEHLTFKWLSADEAIHLTKSPNNAAAIAKYLLNQAD